MQSEHVRKNGPATSTVDEKNRAPNSPALQVLFIDDSSDDALLVSRALEKVGYKINYTRVETADTMLHELNNKKWDLLICDYYMPNFSGPEAVQLLKKTGLDIPIIIVSGTVGEEFAVNAIKNGASDYIMKDNLVRLPSAVDRELREAANRARGREAENQLKEKEEQLRQSQKMEAIGRLAGGVAHDFNNVLATISLYSEMLLADLPPDNKKLKDGIEEILKAKERAAALTRQLLAFSRKKVSQKKNFDINLLILELEKMLKRMVGEDIEFKTRLSSQPIILNADSGQIEQIVMNLVVNSRDAMPTGGSLTISTELVSLNKELVNGDLRAPPGRYLKMSVEDTGVGMSDEVKEKIFEPFFTTKEVGKGTGLGMATVYGIVKQNEGSILIESELSKGAQIHIYLPALKTNQQVSVASNNENFTKVDDIDSGKTLLVVEDDPIVRKMICETLEKYGYFVLSAANGVEALEIFEDAADNISLLVTDVVMPQMGGIELARRVENKCPGLPIIYLSGYTDESIRQSDLPTKNSLHLEKPFSSKDLLARIRTIIGGESAKKI